MIRKIGIVLSAFALAGVLAGCGGDDEGHENMPGAQPGGKANEADIAFATQMIPHHEQAIEMAELVPSRAENPKVKALAEQVEQAQDPEIQMMTGWLKEWGAPMPDDMGGMGHGSADMPGMMSEDDMAMLEKAKGAEFDKMWMTMMIEHHEGAIEMARTELKDGQDAGAKKVAQAIIDGQQAEIDEMKALLKG